MRVMRSEFVVEVLEGMCEETLANAAHPPRPSSGAYADQNVAIIAHMGTHQEARSAVADFTEKLLRDYRAAGAGLFTRRVERERDDPFGWLEVAEIRVRHVQEIDVTTECSVAAADDPQNAQPLPPEAVTPDIKTLRGEPAMEDDLFLEDGGRGKLHVVGRGGKIVGEQG